MIDPRSLRTFLAVCREGTISGAARRLHISQPSVSVAISQLEHTLSAKLFVRSRTGIELTHEGHALKQRAEAMDALLNDAEKEVRLAKEGIRGPLRVGGTPGALVSLLPAAVHRLEDRFEGFALHVLERADSDLIDMLRRGDIELAFVTTGLEQPPADIVEHGVASDPFTVIVGKQNERLPAKMSLKDARQLRWVLPEARGGFRRQVDALFAAAGVEVPRDVIRCDSLLTTKAIVRGSSRVTILPRGVAAAELSIGVVRAIAIREATFDRRVGIRHLRSAKLSSLAAALLEEVERLP